MLLQETQKLNEMQAIDVEDTFADDSDEEELESNEARVDPHLLDKENSTLSDDEN